MSAVYLAFVIAIVPVYGISVAIASKTASAATVACLRGRATRTGGTCPYEVRIRYDASRDAWVIFSSHLRHDHAPDPRIVDNPWWRPRFTNHEAGAAVAEADSAARRAEKTDKGKRKEEELLEVRFLSPLSPLCFLPPLPGILTLTALRSFLLSQPHPQKKQRLSPSHLKKSSPAPAAASAPIPALQPAPTPPSPLQTAYLFTSVSTAPQLVLPTFSPSAFAAFLSSLDPSLASLAPSLLSSGIDSLEALVLLPLLDENRIGQLFDALAGRDGAPAEVERVRLLVRMMAEAKASGWS
jgi:hypothetical protein